MLNLKRDAKPTPHAPMTVDGILHSDETLGIAAPATRGAPPSEVTDSTFAATDSRLLYITGDSFDSINHNAVESIHVSQHPNERPYATKAWALIGATVLTTAFGIFAPTDIAGFMETLTTASLALGAILAFVGIALYAVTREYYETMTVRTSTKTYTFATVKQDAFTKASQLAAANPAQTRSD